MKKIVLCLSCVWKDSVPTELVPSLSTYKTTLVWTKAHLLTPYEFEDTVSQSQQGGIYAKNPNEITLGSDTGFSWKIKGYRLWDTVSPISDGVWKSSLVQSPSISSSGPGDTQKHFQTREMKTFLFSTNFANIPVYGTNFLTIHSSLPAESVLQMS